MKKRLSLIVISIICLVAVTATFVGCNSTFGEWAYEMDVYTTAKALSVLDGKIFLSSSGDLALFSEDIETEEGGETVITTKYSIYNFATEQFVVSSTESDIAFLEYDFGYYMLVAEEADGTLTTTIYDASGAKIYAMSNADYEYTNNFLYVNGEAVVYISPEAGEAITIGSTLAETMQDSYEYVSDSYYVTYSSYVISVYSRDDLSLINKINISDYKTGTSSVSLYMIADDEMLLQVKTLVDPESTKYDYMDSYENKYNVDHYTIGLKKGKISTKKLDYVVSSMSFQLDFADVAWLATGNCVAEINMIEDKALVSSDYVFLNSNLKIVSTFDDYYEGAETIIPYINDTYVVLTADEKLVLLNEDCEVIAYDIEIDSDMFIKGNTYYTMSCEEIYTVSYDETVVGTVSSGVVTAVALDDGGYEYKLNGKSLNIDADASVIVMYNLIYVSETIISEVEDEFGFITNEYSYKTTFYDATGSVIFTNTQDTFTGVSTVSSGSGYVIVDVGNATYYKLI